MFDAVNAGVMTDSFRFANKESSRLLTRVDTDESVSAQFYEESLTDRKSYMMEPEVEPEAELDTDHTDNMGLEDALLQFGITVSDYHTVKVRRRGGREQCGARACVRARVRWLGGLTSRTHLMLSVSRM